MGDLASFAKLLGRSWFQKHGTAKSISNSDIDRAYDEAISAGAIGGKISSAGEGGFMMLICDPSRKMQVVQELEKRGGIVMNCRFVECGRESWSSPLQETGRQGWTGLHLYPAPPVFEV